MIRHVIIGIASLFWAQALAQVPINEKKSSSFMYYYLKGEALLTERKYQEALLNFNEALYLYPYHAESYFSRATVKEKLDDKEGALRDYTLFLELKPDQFDALFNKALILFGLEKWDLAQRDFKRLITLPTGETNSIYFQQDHASSAINQVFTNQGADKSYLYNYLGLTEMELSEYDSARIHFDSAIYYNHNEANYFVNLGQCYEAKGNIANAINAYQTALTIHPSHPIAVHNLHLLQRTNTPQDRQLLDEFVAKNPGAHFVYAERALHKFNNEDFRGAISDYDKAIELQPGESTYWMSRGLARERLNHFFSAYNDYSKAIQLDEQHEKAWLHRANLLYKIGRFEEAIEDYDIALMKFDNYGIALYNRGLAKYKLGKKSAACEDIKQAMQEGFEVPTKVINRICDMQ